LECDKPAVVVERPAHLPRVRVRTRVAVIARLLAVSTAPSGFEGEGFPGKRASRAFDQQYLTPFVTWTRWVSRHAPGEPKGTSWHPHEARDART